MVLEEEVETVHVYTGQRGEPNYRAARPQCALELGGAGGTAYVQKDSSGELFSHGRGVRDIGMTPERDAGGRRRGAWR